MVRLQGSAALLQLLLLLLLLERNDCENLRGL
jgi:hypothetical protein